MSLILTNNLFKIYPIKLIMNFPKFYISITIVILLACGCVVKDSKSAKNDAVCTLNSVAKTPPMGWNSYNCFGGSVTEAEVKQNADYMSKNLISYGWEYIVVDFLWYCDNQTSWQQFKNRRPVQHVDNYGRLIPSTVLHPSSAGGKGLKPLADYIHSKGLKFGIHIMRGIPRQAIDNEITIFETSIKAKTIVNLTDTCKWYGGLVGVDMTKEGAQEYYNSLFKMYAEWGVDFVKVDDISFPYHAKEIEAVRKAINNCGRPIVLSLSPGAAPLASAEHLTKNANMWRISPDFWDNWSRLLEQLKLCRQWAPKVTESHWADADMLPLGHIQIRQEVENAKERYTNFTKDEQYFMMTLWSIFRSPLIFGGNLPDNDEFTLSLITNRDVIRVNQHSINNKELSFENGVSVWSAKDKTDGRVYLAFLNTNDKETKTVFLLEKVNKAHAKTVNNLWLHAYQTVENGSFEIRLPAHGAAIYSIN